MVGGGGVGAPSVTSVLDERFVVGDNNRVWVSPGWECDRISVMRLSNTSAGEDARCRSGSQLTLMCKEASCAVTVQGEVGIA